MSDLRAWLSPLPFVAVLRGLPPADAEPVGRILRDLDFRILEVPLNSPDPLVSIASLAQRFGGDALIGAGTVTAPAEVDAVADAGGRIIVMPHTDAAVIARAVARRLLVLAGATTPSEAFTALHAGAHGLKLFPAEIVSPAALKAMRAVLPRDTVLLPVGGITPERLADYARAGADGFGLGSALYRPGAPPQEVGARAAAFVEAWHQLL